MPNSEISAALAEIERMTLTGDKDGDTVLHLAAMEGSAEVLKYLLTELPFDVVRQLLQIRGFNNLTPLIRIAENRRDSDVMRTMLDFITSNFASAGKYDITLQNFCNK